MNFSVIIPLYNKEPHIERALLSVYRQSHQDFEVIVVDDASTDGGADVVRRLMDYRTRLLRREVPGSGGYAARNFAIRSASGPWVAFLDADDEWKPTFLSTVMDLRKRCPEVQCCGTAYERDFGDGRVILNAYARKHKSVAVRCIRFREYLRETGAGRCPLCTVVVAADIGLVKEVGLFPEGRCTRGGDADTWLRIAERTNIGWSSVVGAVYHRDSFNMVTRLTPPQLHHCLDETVKTMVRRTREARGRLSGIPASSIKRVANYHKRAAVKQMIRRGELRIDDVMSLHFWANPLFVSGAFLASTAPGRITVRFVRHIIQLKRNISDARRGGK